MVLILLALIVGLYGVLWPLENLDLTMFFYKWLEMMRTAGIASAVSWHNYDYQAIYLLLVKVVDVIAPFDAPIDIIKSVAVIGLLPLAWMAYSVGRQRSTPAVALIGAFGLCLLPSVAANTALWGQADTLYAAPAIGAVLCGIYGRFRLAMALFGLAVSIKLQAIFMAPFFAYLFFRQRAPLWQLVYFPLGFATAFVASALAGVEASRGITVYLTQFGYFKRLSQNAPSLWEIVTRIVDVPYSLGVAIGLTFGVAFSLYVAALGFAWWRDRRMEPSGRAVDPDDEAVWLLALLVAIAIPFLLPKMHNRFFFVADILAFLLFVRFRSPFYLLCTALLQVGSLLGYLAFHGMALKQAFGLATAPWHGWWSPLVGAGFMALAFALVLRRQIIAAGSRSEFGRTASLAVEGAESAKQSSPWFDQLMPDLRWAGQWRSWANQGPTLGLYGLFLASGFSALTYQTAWHRMLGLFGGADSISAAIVVGAFLFGLGIGSLVAGLLVDRLSRRQSMIGFAVCELGIALFAVLSPTLFYDVVFGQLLPLAQSRLLVFIVIFIGLLWPTVLMGFSLPLLSKAIVVDIDASARQIGALYGVNTLGAGLGAFMTGWLIIGNLGYDGAVFIAAAINLAVGIAGLALVRAVSAPPTGAPPKPDAAPLRNEPAASANVLPAWCLLVFVSGFLIVALQIVWYRLIGVALQSNAYAFSLVLATLLIGDGLGLLVGARIVDRIPDPRRFFFAMQAVATAIGVGVIYFAYVLFRLPALAPGFVERDIVTSRPVDIVSIVALTLLVVAPGSFAFGFSFPVVQKAVQRDLGVLGRRVGFVQLANILGNSMGSLGIGLLVLHWWGSTGALRLVAIAGLIFALIWLKRVWLGEGSRIGAAGATLAAVALICFVTLFPTTEEFWSRMHRVRNDQVAIVAEDRTGLALLRINRSNFAHLFVQGHSQSTIPFSPIHAYLGVVGSLTHANPEQVLVIGVGGGGTPYAAGVNTLTRQIHAVEIVQPVINVLHQFAAQRGHSGVTELLNDSRFLIEAADGRRVLAIGNRKYDVIEADAFYPKTSLSGLLYSVEFFHQVRTHLNPGGIYVQWSPTARIIRTLRSVFPYVVMVRPKPNDRILLASDRPIEFNGPKIAIMLRQPATLRYLEAARIDVAQLETWFAAEKAEVLNAGKPLISNDVNRDLFPRDEYYLNR